MAASRIRSPFLISRSASWTTRHLFSNHLTLRGEVRYTDLGSDTVSSTVWGQTYRGKFSNSLWTGTIGLGYKF